MGTTFANENVLITGAASGIGRALALELARRGARLALVDRDRAPLEALAGLLGARAYVVDLAQPDAIAPLVARVEDELGPIDRLFSNAGVAVVAPLVSTSEADWDWLFAINVRAPIRLARAALPAMIARRRGHLVFTASLAGLVGAPGMTAYTASKFSLVGLAEALRHELAPHGIAVTTVCPGYVRTNLHRATRYGNVGFRRFLDAPPAWYGIGAERAARRICAGVADRAPLVVFGVEKIGWWLKRLSPAAAFRLTRGVAQHTGILDPSSISGG